ncbi:MAG: chemotaxis protein CheA [Candidatus Cyclobacteriaceae bacterium M2_1C_046]
MKGREQEYKQIFISETNQQYDKVVTLLVQMEKDPGNKKHVHEIFRMLHNLKANAKAMEHETLSETAHKLENIFSQLREDAFNFEGLIVDFIYKAIDYLGYLIKNVDNANSQKPDEGILRELDLIASNQWNLLSENSTRNYSANRLSLSDSVNIPLRKLDDLLNLIGELIIERDQLINFAENLESKFLKDTGSRLHRIANEMQQNVMAARLVSVESLFNKFPRIVRDVAVSEKKKVDLQISGYDTKVDRNILSVITDTMVHLIRNAVSHGIETPEERKKLKKDTEGKLNIIASSEKGQINIIISDDGRGININELKGKVVKKGILSEKSADNLSDRQALMLIFHSGFSMAEQVTEYSGRGVGLDVVKNFIDSIGGDIKVQSKVNKGTTFTLSLPISIAVKTALLFKVRTSFFALPLLNIDSVVNLRNEQIHEVDGNLVVDMKDETIPLIYLNDFLFEKKERAVGKLHIQRYNMDVILLTYGNRKFGLIVDDLVTQQEIVIKPLQQPLRHHELFSGMTLLGSGEVCFILDISSVVKLVELEDIF